MTAEESVRESPGRPATMREGTVTGRGDPRRAHRGATGVVRAASVLP